MRVVSLGGFPYNIDRFIGPYRYLSNFYIEPDGTHVEGEYQESKCLRDSDRQKFKGLGPSEAKKLGRNVWMRGDWEEIKDQVMYDLVLQKFQDHRDLRLKLLSTSPAKLIEGNSWGDKYWGVCDGVGENVLGRILMFVREELLDA